MSLTIPATGTAADLDRLDTLIARQEAAFVARQPASSRMHERARRSLAGGVTSSWQITRPQPVWLSHGEGAHLVDLDGRSYVDLHGGYGVSVLGHGHPAIVAAVTERVPRGTHFAQPSPDAVAVSEELARRFGLPLWRFSNSGTEATMDAVHLLRAATGRDVILKVEGCYHGHHDAVMVSVNNDADELGPADAPHSPASGSGIPKAMTDLTVIVPYNDLDAVARRFAARPGEIAGIILEPIMLNAGIIPPRDGYLQGLVELCHANGALVAFDEVKSGLTIAAGGATERFGVRPDLVALAKAMGGGLPCGAIGGSAEVMGLIEDGGYEQVGTFNGNPLTMAAARATLTGVLDADAYAHLERLQARTVDGANALIADHDLPALARGFGAKGSITFSATPITDYRSFLTLDNRWSHCHWLYQHAGGVFLPPWGKAEQWTLSVQHADDDVDRFLDNFATMCADLRG